MLKGILVACTETYSKEWQSVEGGFGKSPVEHLYIRDWGKIGSLYDLQMDWHIPNEEELLFVKELLDQFLENELNAIKSYVAGKYMTR